MLSELYLRSRSRRGPYPRGPFVAGVGLGTFLALAGLVLGRHAVLTLGALAIIGWVGCLLAAVILRSPSTRWLLLGVLMSSIATGVAAVLAVVAQMPPPGGFD